LTPLVACTILWRPRDRGPKCKRIHPNPYPPAGCNQCSRPELQILENLSESYLQRTLNADPYGRPCPAGRKIFAIDFWWGKNRQQTTDTLTDHLGTPGKLPQFPRRSPCPTGLL